MGLGAPPCGEVLKLSHFLSGQVGKVRLPNNLAVFLSSARRAHDALAEQAY
jgi:hypothetical protein